MMDSSDSDDDTMSDTDEDLVEAKAKMPKKKVRKHSLDEDPKTSFGRRGNLHVPSHITLNKALTYQTLQEFAMLRLQLLKQIQPIPVNFVRSAIFTNHRNFSATLINYCIYTQDFEL